MKHSMLLLFVFAASAATVTDAQSPDSCADLAGLKLDRVEVSKAELVPAGFMVPSSYPGAPSIGPLSVTAMSTGSSTAAKVSTGRNSASDSLSPYLTTPPGTGAS